MIEQGKYGHTDGFVTGGAIQAIDVYIQKATERRNRLNREIDWLTELRTQRQTQLDMKAWPPKGAPERAVEVARLLVTDMDFRQRAIRAGYAPGVVTDLDGLLERMGLAEGVRDEQEL